MTLRVQLAGRVGMVDDSAAVDNPSLGGAARVLFVYLVVQRGRTCTREDLAAAMWEGPPPTTWESALRNAVARIRNCLAPVGLPPETLSWRAGLGYQLVLPPGSSVDVERAEEAVLASEHAVERGEWERARALATSAHEIAAQQVLIDRTAGWLTELRHRLSLVLLRTLDVMGAVGLGVRDFRAAARVAEQALSIDTYHETALRTLMHAQSEAGNPGEAIRSYHRTRARLADELGVDPARETRALFEEILRSLHGPAQSTSSEASPRRRVTFAPPEVVEIRGRTDEIAALRRIWASIPRGVSRLALISGEAGTGKSSLAREISRQLAAEGASVLLGRSEEQLGVPFGPFVEALTAWATRSPKAMLRNGLGFRPGELTRLVPDLARIVPGLPPPTRADPATEVHLLFSAITSWLAAQSEHCPAVLVLEDLHWASEPTLYLLRHVLTVRGESAPTVLVVGTCRTGELGAEHIPDVLTQPEIAARLDRLHLGGLDRVSVLQIVADLARNTPEDQRAELAQRLHRLTAGNPFFVVELIRQLDERSGTRYAESALTDVPPSIREAIGKRVRRLPSHASQLLTLASVIGDEFELPLLAAVSTLDTGTVLNELEAACRQQFLDEVGVDSYRFRHSLIRAVLSTDISVTRRARLHQRIADELARQQPGQVAAIARHYAAGGASCATQAVDYLAKAGDLALERLAYDDAVTFYRQALEHDPAPRLDLAQRCRHLLALGRAQRLAGQAAHRQTLFEAAELATEIDEPRLLISAALENNRGAGSSISNVDEQRVEVLHRAMSVAAALDPPDAPSLAMLLATLSGELSWSDRSDLAVELSDQALSLARAAGNQQVLARVLGLRYYAIDRPSLLPERLTNTAENLQVADALGDPSERFNAALRRSWACLNAGDIAEVDHQLDRLKVLLNDTDVPLHRWSVGVAEAWRLLLAGELARAEKAVGASLQLGLAAEQPDALAVFGFQLYLIRWEQGRLGELVDQLQQAVDDYPDAIRRSMLAFALLEDGQPNRACEAAQFDTSPPASMSGLPTATAWCFFAEVAARTGERGAARGLYEVLLPFESQLASSSVGTTGAIARYLGLLAGCVGDDGRARRHLKHALDIHTSIGAESHVARTELDLAEILGRSPSRPDRCEARDLAQRAHSTADRLAMTTLRERTAAVLNNGV